MTPRRGDDPDILILGGSGQVGMELRHSLAPWGTVEAPPRAALELTDLAAVDDYLDSRSPGLIVNAAAWTGVDAAEAEPDVAFRLNAELPACLARKARARGIVLMHYSSDYVYPGTGHQARHEDSPAGPLSVYGESKLAGDAAIQSSGARHLIFRTSWIYSPRGRNFLKTMLRLGREREALQVVADQIGAPTPARLIAETSAQAWGRLRQGRLAPGLYHLAARGETSWHGFATEIFRLARERGMSLAIDRGTLNAIATRDYPTPATRPLNSRLDTRRLEQGLGMRLPTWQAQLAPTLDELLSQPGWH